MKIYLDVIFVINFVFDFLLLMCVHLVQKRKVCWNRILLGSLLASFSVFLLFIKINSLELFVLKFLISVMMIFVTFGRLSFWKNMLYLYFSSIVLGGFLYFINMQVSYKNDGLVFFYNGFSMNIVLLVILSPIILYCYYKQSRYFQETLSNIHTVEVFFKNKCYSYRAYLDTGNKLYDPYKHREVILLYDTQMYEEMDEFLIVPFETVSGNGFLKGMVVSQIVVDSKHIFKNVVIGVSKDSFSLDGAEMILHGNFLNRI